MIWWEQYLQNTIPSTTVLMFTPDVYKRQPLNSFKGRKQPVNYWPAAFLVASLSFKNKIYICCLLYTSWSYIIVFWHEHAEIQTITCKISLTKALLIDFARIQYKEILWNIQKKGPEAVSYTHLDVYKRQVRTWLAPIGIPKVMASTRL